MGLIGGHYRIALFSLCGRKHKDMDTHTHAHTLILQYMRQHTTVEGKAFQQKLFMVKSFSPEQKNGKPLRFKWPGYF